MTLAVVSVRAMNFKTAAEPIAATSSEAVLGLKVITDETAPFSEVVRACESAKGGNSCSASPPLSLGNDFVLFVDNLLTLGLFDYGIAINV